MPLSFSYSECTVYFFSQGAACSSLHLLDYNSMNSSICIATAFDLVLLYLVTMVLKSFVRSLSFFVSSRLPHFVDYINQGECNLGHGFHNRGITCALACTSHPKGMPTFLELSHEDHRVSIGSSGFARSVMQRVSSSGDKGNQLSHTRQLLCEAGFIHIA